MIPRPRASDAWRVWMCPRSHTAEHTLVEFGLLPAERPNLHASYSTTQHQALAGESVDLSEEQAGSVAESASEITEFLAREHLNGAKIDQRELPLESDFWTGHIDRAIAQGDTGAVIDYKQISWGDHYHAADNPQIWVYIYLLWTRHHLQLKQCWGVIKQPGHPITATLFTEKNLDDLRRWAVETSEKAMDPTSELHAGDWCQHCRLKAICPEGVAYLGKTQSLAEDDELPVSNPIILGMLLDRFRVLGWFEDAIKNLSKILLRQDANSVQGWKLTRGREVTLIKDLDLAYQTTYALGIDDSAWHDVSPKKLRTLLEERMTPEAVSKIIDVVREPGALIRMSKQERKALEL